MTAPSITNVFPIDETGLRQKLNANYIDLVDYLTFRNNGSVAWDDISTLSPWVDVRAKGAVGDGTTDDTAAILSAIDEVATTGGVVLFPPATYLIGAGDGINIVKSNITLMFSNGAILKKSGTGGAITIARENNLTISNIRIFGGKITSADTTTANSGIVITADATNRVDRLWIENVWIDGMGQYGIVAGGTINYGYFSNINITNNGSTTGNHVRQSFILNPVGTSVDLFVNNVYGEQINDGTGLTDGSKIQKFVGASINNLTIKGGNVSTLVLDDMQGWTVNNIRVIGTGGNGFTFDSTATGRAEITNVVCTGSFASSNAIVLGGGGCVDVSLRNFRAVGHLMGATTGAHTRLVVENGYLSTGVRLDTEASVSVANSVFSDLRTETGLYYIIGNNNELYRLRSNGSTSSAVIVSGNSNIIRHHVHLSPTSAGIQVAGNSNFIDSNYCLTPGTVHINITSGTGNIVGLNNGAVSLTDSGTSTTNINTLLGKAGHYLISGTGTPEGAVTAPVGSIYFRTNGGTGTTLYIKESGTGNTGWVGMLGSGSDHGSLAGLTDDDHTQYSLLAGRSGGQSLIGGTAASNSLTLRSTSNATRGKVIFGNAGTTAYDEVNERVGIGTASPGEALDVAGNARFNLWYNKNNFTTFADADTTPSVANNNCFVANNTAGTTITNFDDGVASQIIIIHFANGNTTVARNNSFLAGGVNFTGTGDDTITLQKRGDFWYEIARSVNA